MSFWHKFTVNPSILGCRRWVNNQMSSPLHQLSIYNDKLDEYLPMHHERVRKHKKNPIYGSRHMNGDVVVVCNRTGSYIMIIQHFLGT